MRILLVRHAEAAPGEPDETRLLTRRGRDQAADLGRKLADEGVAGILSSPYPRARQTADAIADATGATVSVDDRIGPGADAEGLVAAARELDPGERLVVAIGHQPDCGHIAAELSDGPPPAFPPAGTARFDVP
jgi:phosphohistidine phosphatase